VERLLPRVIAQRLEGSRFGACFVALANSSHDEPGRKRAAASGSRERPSAPQLYRPDVNESKARGKCITLGGSREPPVATFCGQMKRWNEYRGFV